MQRYHLICRGGIAVAMWALPVLAQHPSEVHRLEAEGSHLKALVAYDSMASRSATKEAISSAARSAWALGLSDRARLEFDKIALDSSSSDVEKARAFLSKGIIEYQEERYSEAILFAEKVIQYLKGPSPLRANAYLLWAESLARQSKCGQATALYVTARNEADPIQYPEISFLQGECEFAVGRHKEAGEAYLAVPLRHPRSPEAMRRLAEIALADKNPSHAAFWISKGRDLFPDRFTDSWSAYIELTAAIAKGDEAAVSAVIEQSQKRYPPSDSWLILMNAAAEEFAWKNKIGGSGGSSQARATN